MYTKFLQLLTRLDRTPELCGNWNFLEEVVGKKKKKWERSGGDREKGERRKKKEKNKGEHSGGRSGKGKRERRKKKKSGMFWSVRVGKKGKEMK